MSTYDRMPEVVANRGSGVAYVGLTKLTTTADMASLALLGRMVAGGTEDAPVHQGERYYEEDVRPGGLIVTLRARTIETIDQLPTDIERALRKGDGSATAEWLFDISGAIR